MKSGKSIALLPLVGLLCFLAQTQSAEAAIHIYKVAFSAKAQSFPKPFPLGNSQKASGYLIYDTVNPANSQTVQVFSNKTYKFNGDGNLLGLIFPSQITFAAVDLKPDDPFPETARALVAFVTGPSAVARSYLGTIPKPPGFKLGGVFFNGIAKSLKGSGSVTTLGAGSAGERFTITDSWTLDALSALPAVLGTNDTNVGVTAVVAFLQGQGFVQG